MVKVFIQLYYFFRSWFKRGFFNTIKLIRGEKVNEKLYEISTSSIKKSNSTEFFHYQGAGYLVLFRIFQKIVSQTKDFEFVDIGSGKGRVIFVAESFGYKNLTGIELDNELIKDSLENLKHYSLKNATSKITFININAINYNYKNQPAVYFLFNPFNGSVLKKVLDKIVESTKEETWFVYMNPNYLEAFSPDVFEVIYEIKTQKYLEAMVYKIKRT